MCTALVILDNIKPVNVLSLYEQTVLTGKLPKKICKELDNEEWSKPYTDIDEMFKDLGLFDD